jgi:hypothetical protein
MATIIQPVRNLVNGTRINGVEHFYQSAKPNTRIDGSPLAIGDRWINPTTEEVGTFNGLYFLGRKFIVSSGLSVINVSVRIEDTTSIFLRDIVAKGMVATTPNWNASNQWQCNFVFNEVQLSNLAALNSLDGFTNVNSNVYKKFVYNTAMIGTPSQRGNSTVILQIRSVGSPTAGNSIAGVSIEYIATFSYIL